LSETFLKEAYLVGVRSAFEESGMSKDAGLPRHLRNLAAQVSGRGGLSAANALNLQSLKRLGAGMDGLPKGNELHNRFLATGKRQRKGPGAALQGDDGLDLGLQASSPGWDSNPDMFPPGLKPYW